jgi:adenylate kinase family enzyme
MIRVSIVGTSCSGKTTLARGISSVMGIPHFELDAIHWLPNWTPRPIDLFRAAVEEATTGDRWVIDGNYSKVRDIIWSRATDVV